MVTTGLLTQDALTSPDTAQPMFIPLASGPAPGP